MGSWFKLHSGQELSKGNHLLSFILAAVVCLLILKGSAFGATTATFFDPILVEEIRYSELLKEWLGKGFAPVSDIEIVIPGGDITVAGDAHLEIRESFQGKAGPILLWKDSAGYAEWSFNVPKSGLYRIGLQYFPLQGDAVPGRPIERGFMIDGEYPFDEARRLVLYRAFRDAGEGEFYNTGDEKRPRQEEISGWVETDFKDAEATILGPFMVYLEAGNHTLRLVGRSEPLAIASILVRAPEELPSYSGYLQQQIASPLYMGKDVKFEGEDTYRKSMPSLRREPSSDPTVTPFDVRHRRLNVFGGWTWRKGGEWAEWKFTVPEDGLYKIGVHCLQNASNELPSYRRIEIDGQVPFVELERYEFPYQVRWRLDTLADEQGNPYLFHLSKGEHILRMTPVVGPLEPVLHSLETVILDMASLYRRIIMITGTNPDLNFEYELEKQIPDLVSALEAISRELEYQARFVEKTLGSRGAIGNLLLSVSEQLADMAAYPHTVPGRIQVLVNNPPALSEWIRQLKEGPLSIDEFRIGARDAIWEHRQASIIERMRVSLNHLLLSFQKDYNQIGNIYEDEEDDVVTIWVQRSREMNEIMKNLIEEDFTSQTGIRVNINTLPPAMGGDIMSLIRLAAIGGNSPDVIMGVDPSFPVELAIRGVAANLNQFEGYDDIRSRFREGALIPYHWKGGDYAIPESQDYQLLFYRKDILSELALDVPDTWEDVYKAIPILRRYRMYFAGDPGFEIFVYKHGGRFYADDGLRTELHTPEALAAFVEWTDLYTKYGMPIGANAYWHFRAGDMPIITGGFQQYLLLKHAAPELTNRWGIAPLPGYRLPSGDTARTAGSIAMMGGGQTKVAMIFSISEQKEKAWRLLDWWTSASVQERFAHEVEGLIGMEARWNTANMEALKHMPWDDTELDVILEQLSWIREIPVVLGGYMTTRYTGPGGIAWTQVVIEGEKPKDAMEEAVKEINKELTRKAKEFGLLPEGDEEALREATGKTR